MKSNRYLIITGVLVAGAALVLVGDFFRRSTTDKRLKQPLVEATVLGDVTKIEVARGKKKTLLVRGEGNRWTINTDSDFPADGQKVARLFDSLTKTTFERVAARAADDTAGFGMDNATTLRLIAGEKDVVALRLGENRTGGGQYAKIGDEKPVYLVSQSVSADTDAPGWELKSVFNLKKEELKTLEIVPPEGSAKKPVKFVRDKAEDAVKVDGIATGEKEKAGATAPIAAMLEGITFTKRYDSSNEEARTALAKPLRVMATSFDGLTYVVEIGTIGEKEKQKTFFRVQADKGNTSPSSDKEASLGQLKMWMEKWAFEVGSHVFTKFDKGRDDFVEPDTAAAAATPPATPEKGKVDGKAVAKKPADEKKSDEKKTK